MKPGSNRNETGQHPEWARCDRSSSEKLGSELARSGSEFLGATRSSSDGHYTVTTQSLRGHYAVTTRFSLQRPARCHASQAEQTKASHRKNMAEARANIIKQVCENPRTGFGNQAETLKQARLQDSPRLRGLQTHCRAIPHRRAATTHILNCTWHDALTTRFLRSRRGHDGTVTTRSRRSHGHDRVTTRHDAATTRFVVTTRSRQGHDAVTTRSSETQSPQSQLRARILRFHSRISQKHQQVRLKVEERQGWTTLAQNYCHAGSVPHHAGRCLLAEQSKTSALPPDFFKWMDRVCAL